MEVRVERLPKSVAKISVTIDPATVGAATEKAFRKLNQRYTIPGFRRGKAPRTLFERYVGKDLVLNQAAEDLIQAGYREALKQTAVRPLAEPRVSLDKELAEGEPFQFSIEVEAHPEVELGDYRAVAEAEPLEPAEVTEEMVEAELKELARSHGQLVPADDQPVEPGNRVVLKVRGFLQATPPAVDTEEAATEDSAAAASESQGLEQAAEEDPEPFVEDDQYPVEVGSGQTLPDFERQLVGLKVGEPTEIRFRYPDDYPDPDLKGKWARFEVTVTENKRLEVPPVDDELAVTAGMTDLQELRETVTNRLQRRLQEQARNARVARILGKLRERTTVEVPESLVEEVIHRELHDLESSLERLGLRWEEYLAGRPDGMAGLREELRPAAVEEVYRDLILEAVARDLGIVVSDEEVVESLRPLAESAKERLDTVVQIVRKNGQFEMLRRNLVLALARERLADIPAVAVPAGESEAPAKEEAE